MECVICGGRVNLTDTYGTGTCEQCGAMYKWDEGQQLQLSQEQREALRSSGMKPTQKEQLVTLLNEFGIAFREFVVADKPTVEFAVGDQNVSGYLGFTATWEFDASGQFATVKLWE